MSWLVASEYGPLARAKGMRFPPMIAARRPLSPTFISSHRPRPGASLLTDRSAPAGSGYGPDRMADRYQRFATSGPGQVLTKRLGLPPPAELRRHRPGDPLLRGPALLGAAPGGRLAGATAHVLRAAGAPTFLLPDEELRELATRAGARTSAFSPEEDGDRRFAAILYDAGGIRDSGALEHAYSFLHPVIRRIERSGRLLVLATPPELSEDPRQAVAQRALEGFVRSAAKEVGHTGATANLVYVAPGAEGAVGVDASLLPVGAVRVRGRPGGADRRRGGARSGRLGAPAGGQAGGGHGRVARHRGGDRRDAGPRRRPRRLPRCPGAGRRSCRGGQPHPGRDAPARHRVRVRTPHARGSPARASRRRGRDGPQRRASHATRRSAG